MPLFTQPDFDGERSLCVFCSRSPLGKPDQRGDAIVCGLGERFSCQAASSQRRAGADGLGRVAGTAPSREEMVKSWQTDRRVGRPEECTVASSGSSAANRGSPCHRDRRCFGIARRAQPGAAVGQPAVGVAEGDERTRTERRQARTARKLLRDQHSLLAAAHGRRRHRPAGAAALRAHAQGPAARADIGGRAPLLVRSGLPSPPSHVASGTPIAGENEVLDAFKAADPALQRAVVLRAVEMIQAAMQPDPKLPAADVKHPHRDRTGWLGREDSNLCISKSDLLNFIPPQRVLGVDRARL
jgi:hypothetical protein